MVIVVVFVSLLIVAVVSLARLRYLSMAAWAQLTGSALAALSELPIVVGDELICMLLSYDDSGQVILSLSLIVMVFVLALIVAVAPLLRIKLLSMVANCFGDEDVVSSLADCVLLSAASWFVGATMIILLFVMMDIVMVSVLLSMVAVHSLLAANVSSSCIEDRY